MGLFSRFKKRNPDEIYKSIEIKVMIASLAYGKGLDNPNDMLSANVGAELGYLMLHLIERIASNVLDHRKVGEVQDRITLDFIYEYTRTVLRPETPLSVLETVRAKMLETYNSRALTYANCSSIYGENLPSPGSMVFAFCFLVNHTLGLINIVDFDKILAGQESFSDNSEIDTNGFPNFENLLNGVALIARVIKSLDISKDLKQLS